MLIYLIVIFSFYLGFLLVCIAGWQKFVRSKKSHSEIEKKFVSVVVAVRNEELSVSLLLDSLRFQDFPHDRFEVILVNDHSTDNTEQVVSDWIKDNPHVRCIFFPSGAVGKKQALTEGISNSKGEIILTTDADCDLPTDWISRMVMSFDDHTTMVVGLVKILPEKSLFSKIQAMEFTSLLGSSIALLSHGFPAMCNGASLAFRKMSYEEVNGYQDNLHIPSGDDEFLMRKLEKRFPGSVKSIQWPSVIVATRSQSSLISFIHQRLRWAGKWRVNDSLATKLLALFILVVQVSTIAAWCLLFLGDNRLIVGMLLITRILLEGYFLFTVSRKLHQRFSIPAFIVLQIVYPFYVVIIGVLSQLLDYEWKGRSGESMG